MQPDFNRLLAVLRREPVEKAVLFEFIIDEKYQQHFAGPEICRQQDDLGLIRISMHAFYRAGYDYCIISPWRAGFMTFTTADIHKLNTISLNDSVLITDWDSFERYPWPVPGNYDYGKIERLGKEMPDGMKFIVSGYGGILETAISLTGFENLCIMALTDEALTAAIFNEIGKCFYEYYHIVGRFTEVGALIQNDDWGFKTQTMLSPDLMAKYVFPWHRKINALIHSMGKPAILHSCGNLSEVMDVIIDDLGYDGKHSFEDVIMPVEEAYEQWGRRIAILGGIDVNFLATATPDEIFTRTCKLIEQTSGHGGYAVGSGNSITSYVPFTNYMAMLEAARQLLP